MAPDSRPYPPFSPFPFQGASSDNRNDEEVDEASGLWPTYQTDAVVTACQSVTQFLALYRDGSQVAPLAFVGAHGSGKTHAVLYCRQLLEKSAAASPNSGRQPIVLYAKAEGSDMPALYQSLTAKLTLIQWRELAERFVASVTSRQVSREVQDGAKADEINALLREAPEMVTRLFQSYLVEEGAVQASQSAEVLRIAGDQHEFQRALSYLLTPHLADVAWRWLTGRSVEADEARKIGVAGTINTPEMAKWALQLLALLCERANQPLVFCIDQFERLVVENGAVHTQNAGLLHSLVEVIPSKRALLLIAGTDSAWNLLPPDFRQRFSGNVVQFPLLTPSEAEGIIKAYLGPANTGAQAGGNDMEALWPFERRSVQEMLCYGGGNVRRLLQYCSALFLAGAPDARLIDAGFAREQLQDRTKWTLDEKAIGFDIERALQAGGWRMRREVPLGGRRVDFAVSGEDGIPRLYVQVTRAIFYNDEARRALENIHLSQTIEAQPEAAPLVLVVSGYVTREVLGQLRQGTYEVIVYDPDSFAQRFERVLARVSKAAGPPANNTRDRVEIDKQFADLKMQLARLLEVRNAEARSTNQRVSGVLREQEAKRTQENWDRVRRDWANERSQLEERIQAARAQRQLVQFAELQALHDNAQKAKTERIRRKMLPILVIPAAFAFGCVVYLLKHALFMDRWYLNESLVLALSTATGTFAVMLLFIVRPEIFFAFVAPFNSRPPELLSFAPSLGHLRNRALSYARLGGRRQNIGRWLQDEDPYLRFAAVTLCGAAGRNVDEPNAAGNPRALASELIKAIENEDCAILRRLLAQELAESRYEPFFDYQDLERLCSRVAEMTYFVERNPGRFANLPRWGFTSAQFIVYFRAASGDFFVFPKGEGDRDSLTKELIRAIRFAPNTPRAVALAEAYGSDFSSPSHSELGFIGLPEIRQAVRDLSPLDEGGVGTFDFLQDIHQVDQFYLFFRQFRLLKESGLLQNPVDP